MKVSENWVNEFFAQPIASIDDICEQLTMLGLEVEGYAKRNQNSHVFVGYVSELQPHPSADKLQVCTVYVDKACQQPLSIVCGAANIRSDCYVPVACIGSQLANGLTIQETELRGVVSQGMICSEKELGLSEQSQGILILSAQPQDIGQSFSDWAMLNDYVIDLSITPNRGDCLSMLGIARELKAAYDQPMLSHTPKPVLNQHDNQINVNNQASQACPRYLTCWLTNVNNQADLPYWLIERLHRCDIRSVNPVVDLLNYVMLELGQPMHAFNIDALQGDINVRYAQLGESLQLLGEQEFVKLDEQTLVIADDNNPLAIAGVKGGDASAVDSSTQTILLESAFFEPSIISGVARRYNLNTDSAYRFERGVDYQLPQQALERAIELIQYYLGGQAGPIQGSEFKDNLLKKPVIDLSKEAIQRHLGIRVNSETVSHYLQSLAMQVTDKGESWQIIPPSWRFDIEISADLLEEIARLYGYNALESKLPQLSPSNRQAPLQRDAIFRLKHLLQDIGYHEAINYSFIDEQSNKWFEQQYSPVVLSNPIALDMAQMRVSLWPGLLKNIQHNHNRQQHDVRLFEEGLCFYRDSNSQKIVQKSYVGGVKVGARIPEHWSLTKTPTNDFFDIKGDIENILQQYGLLNNCTFQAVQHPILHPGQAASIYYGSDKIGHVGCLHPNLARDFDLKDNVYLFELDVELLHSCAQQPIYQNLSKFPQVRRDFAFIVPESIRAIDIEQCIRNAAGDWLVSINFFDVFTSEAIGLGYKSVAVAVIWQHPQRTFQEGEIQALCNSVMQGLNKDIGAQIRD